MTIDNSELLYPPRTIQATESPLLKTLPEPFGLTEPQQMQLEEYVGLWAQQYRQRGDYPVEKSTFYPGYFIQNEQAWSDFQSVFGATGPVPQTTAEFEEVFFGVEKLNKSSEKKRKELERASLEWAKNKFVADFIAAKGDLEKVADPERVSRLVDPEMLGKRAIFLRRLKNQIRKEKKLVGQGEKDNLSEAKLLVLDLTRQSLNLSLSNLHQEATILARDRSLDKTRAAEILDIVRRGDDARKPDREEDQTRKLDFYQDRYLYTLQRIDRFINGAGLTIGPEGEIEVVSIPPKLESELRELITKSSSVTPEYEKYAKVKVDSGQMQKLTEMAIKYMGLSGWQARVIKNRKFFSTSSDLKGGRWINLPDTDQNILDALRLIRHETVHAWREEMRSNFKFGVRSLLVGRDEDLSESAALWMEDDEFEAMCQMRKGLRDGVYLASLVARRSKGSFKDCFKTVLTAQAGGTEQDLQILMAGSYLSEARKAFRSTLRAFHAGEVPLSDTSGYLGNTEELGYHLYPLLFERLQKLGLMNMVFVSGLDMFNLCQLSRLGAIDLSKVKLPPKIMSENIWPELKRRIDAGEDLGKVINQLHNQSLPAPTTES